MAGSVSTENNIENLDFSTRPVPPEHRMSKGSLTMAWWAVSSAVFYFVVAAALAQGFGARNAIIGMLLSVVVYSVVNFIISRFAIDPVRLHQSFGVERIWSVIRNDQRRRDDGKGHLEHREDEFRDVRHARRP